MALLHIPGNDIVFKSMGNMTLCMHCERWIPVPL